MEIYRHINGFNKNRFCLANLLAAFLFFQVIANAQTVKNAKPVSPISIGDEKNLVYVKDSLGNRISDFSFAGYKAGEAAIPDIPIRVSVPLVKGDATHHIQSAIDYVSSLTADANGFRGAILLGKGQYEVHGGLYIKASGVVLRGSGMNANGTIIIGTGNDRKTLITITGKNDRITENPVRIIDPYVPVNARKIHVAKSNAFKVGDHVLIHRPSTKEWIKTLGADHFGGGITSLGWKPGKTDLYWDRKITAVDEQFLTFDSPLTTALDSIYGGGYVIRYNWPGRIQQSAVENLRLISSYDSTNLKDEAHRWMAITMENINDAWVRQVVFQHFAGSAVAVLETAKRVTIEDCKSLAPVSEIGGQRRYTFYTSGQQTLFQRCYAEFGYHDFSTGFTASLNAFVQCESHLPFSFSGSIDSWASGILFDMVNVDGGALSYLNRGQDAQGAGWAAANSVLWQCTASRIDNYKPPTANNWAIGCWSEFSGDGYWESSNEHVSPRSLYYAQLAARLGDTVLKNAFLLPVESEASSSPSVEVAADLTNQSVKPAILLKDWIDEAPLRRPIPIIPSKQIVQEISNNKTANKAALTQIKNGWLVKGDEILSGKRAEQPWWRGNTHPDGVKEAIPAITRFVPGRTGKGLTDDLAEMTDSLAASDRVVFEHNYGLWYERRRDDHERIRRLDGEVWPPFYELPFARSGKETAWDGLSKYDLRKYNYWYWNRLKTFADYADEKGLVLIHHNYFQHNIIEAGAHYADFPWRPANNINNTGFPEPVPYAGDKRVFMAEQFYDTSHEVRRTLHRAYIKQCLTNFNDNNSVIQFISAEYTGPLRFVQFWLNVINEWEKETGKKQIIGLSTTKDVQDAILSDPSRAAVVDLIDIRYWHYQADGTTYAPAGGKNLAPRQHARLLKPKKTSFEQVYRAVREYKQKYPSKAVIYSGDSYDQYGWAGFIAGGSLPVLPTSVSKTFLTSASGMTPLDLPGQPLEQWALGNERNEYIVYSNKTSIQLDLAKAANNFSLQWIDPENGHMIGKEQKIASGKLTEFKSPQAGAVVLWLRRL